MKFHRRVTLLVAAIFITAATWLFLSSPGPTNFNEKEGFNHMYMKVHKIHSPRTLSYLGVEAVGMCSSPASEASPSLDQTLLGHLLSKTMEYRFEVGEEPCIMACNATVFTKNDVLKLKHYIHDDYTVAWDLDNLPAYFFIPKEWSPSGRVGIPLGRVDHLEGNHKRTVLYNHYEMLIEYYVEPDTSPAEYRVTFVMVQPRSIDYRGEIGSETECNGFDAAEIELEQFENSPPVNIHWSYSYEFRRIDLGFPGTPWEDRWERYVAPVEAIQSYHNFGTIRSSIVVLVLSTYVAISLYRAIRSPPLPSSDGEVPFEIRWKVVFGDVFRRPNHPEAFAVIAGASAQALATSAIWLALAFLNLVGPQAIHGLNWTSLLLIWTVSSIIAGYTTGFLLHLFNIPHWKRASVVSSHAPPAICFLIAVGVNLPYYSSTASAIPIVTLWLLPVTWMAVSVPFALLGGYLSSVDAKGVYLGRVATTPRPIYQKKPLWLHPAISFLACGILPFATAHTEIYLLMHSLWGQTSTESLYISPHVFGVFPLMLAVSALTTIVGCYYAISHEDWRWWWRSLLTVSGSGLVYFFYCIYFFNTKMGISASILSMGGVQFLGYSLLMAIGISLVNTAAGFFAALWFIKKIFSSVHFE